MKAYAKIDKLLSERKTPMAVHDIANYFLLSKKTVDRTLKELEQSGTVKRLVVGRKNYWSGVYYAR
jgi:predicted transcriptional regulator